MKYLENMRWLSCKIFFVGCSLQFWSDNCEMVASYNIWKFGTSMSEVGRNKRGKDIMGPCSLFICPLVADWPSNPYFGKGNAKLVWSGGEFLLWPDWPSSPATHTSAFCKDLFSCTEVIWSLLRCAFHHLTVYKGVLVNWGTLSCILLCKNIARGIVACGRIVLQWWQDRICCSSSFIAMFLVVELSSNCGWRAKKLWVDGKDHIFKQKMHSVAV